MDALHRAQDEATRAGLQPGTVAAAPFALTRYLRRAPGAARLVVYLEGDAPAWRAGGRQVSQRPPPLAPLALSLAARDPAPAVAWLGRPCQGVDPEAAGCDPSLWSDRRFSETVVAALDEALDALREAAGARELELVGYSGGGVLAALLAARRSDVARLVTVSAPLALGDWRAHHGLGPLDAEDPARIAAPRLDAVPQVHWAGSRDAVVPAWLIERYCRARSAALDCRVRVAEVDHGGWRDAWPRTLRQSRR